MQHAIPVLVPVHDAGREVVDICARADQQQDDEQEGLEVEERRLEQQQDVSNRSPVSVTKLQIRVMDK